AAASRETATWLVLRAAASCAAACSAFAAEVRAEESSTRRPSYCSLSALIWYVSCWACATREFSVGDGARVCALLIPPGRKRAHAIAAPVRTAANRHERDTAIPAREREHPDTSPAPSAERRTERPLSRTACSTLASSVSVVYRWQQRCTLLDPAMACQPERRNSRGVFAHATSAPPKTASCAAVPARVDPP